MNTNCNHVWEEKKNKMVCKMCGKDTLKLSATKFDGLQVGTTDNGHSYSVRDDRSRFFFPEEWILFYDALPERNKPIFDCLINTGARIDEAMNITPDDFTDGTKKTLTLRVTKKKAKKQERIGKKRTFVISSQFFKRMKRYIEDNKIGPKDCLFTMTQQGVWGLLRRRLEKQEVKDWYNFSLHNIRKTHGMYLVALGVQNTEICFRLGHDMNTFLKHYGSPNIFDSKHKLLMLKILGDVYNLQ